jgi:spermidine/putrescine transport system substrate-binding protein
MVSYPRERWPIRRASISRRDFLARSAATATALSGASALLAACGGNGTTSRGQASSAGIEIATPQNPVTLPIAEDNQPIESGLDPEAGPLKIYNWDEYVWPRVVKDFAAEYKVDFEISTFYNMEEAVSKLRTGQVDFDVFFPEIDVVPKLAAAKLLRPLNHSYLPNLKGNVWPSLADPFYDRRSRYTVPYVVYTTGIAWRTDMVDEDIGARDNPYEVFWDSTYRGRIGIYDSYREAMAMVLLKNGITDINTDDPDHIELVEKELSRMAEATSIRTSIAGAYEKLPQGEFAVHQSWSGDIVAAPYYFPEKDYGDPRGLLRYWWPESGKGDVNNDTIAILAGGKNPVLAHHFLNFLLDTKHAVKNFSWVGYQPPMQDLDPGQLVKDGYVVPNLKRAIVRPRDLDTGIRELALPPEVDAMWQDAWSAFKSGA